MQRCKLVLVSATIVLLTSACATGDLGSVFGSGDNAPRSERDQPLEQRDQRPPRSETAGGADVRGELQALDARNRILRLTIDDADAGIKLRNSRREIEIDYDDHTTVHYQGQQYPVPALEVGDRIAVVTREDRNRVIADRIDVLYDSTGGSAALVAQGWVLGVYPRAAEFEIEDDDRKRTLFQYHRDTVVEYQGRRDYSPENLERGDAVEVSYQLGPDNTAIATHVLVTQSVR